MPARLRKEPPPPTPTLTARWLPSLVILVACAALAQPAMSSTLNEGANVALCTNATPSNLSSAGCRRTVTGRLPPVTPPPAAADVTITFHKSTLRGAGAASPSSTDMQGRGSVAACLKRMSESQRLHAPQLTVKTIKDPTVADPANASVGSTVVLFSSPAAPARCRPGGSSPGAVDSVVLPRTQRVVAAPIFTPLCTPRRPDGASPTTACRVVAPPRFSFRRLIMSKRCTGVEGELQQSSGAVDSSQGDDVSASQLGGSKTPTDKSSCCSLSSCSLVSDSDFGASVDSRMTSATTSCESSPAPTLRRCSDDSREYTSAYQTVSCATDVRLLSVTAPPPLIYQRCEQLGEGSFGKVFLGKNAITGQTRWHASVEIPSAPTSAKRSSHSRSCLGVVRCVARQASWWP